jgi:hypothetical protein
VQPKADENPEGEGVGEGVPVTGHDVRKEMFAREASVGAHKTSISCANMSSKCMK